MPLAWGLLASAALGVATGCADGRTGSELADDSEDAAPEHTPSGAGAAADNPPAVSATVTRELYHRPGIADATSLEVASDGTFRWRIMGCDFGGGDVGRWESEDDKTVLLPRPGRATFQWLGHAGVSPRAMVILRNTGEGLEADLGEPQAWSPGGRCAKCADGSAARTDGGGIALGPIGSVTCDEPFAGWSGPYEPR